jgi:excisionase family DNA binding protein
MDENRNESRIDATVPFASKVLLTVEEAAAVLSISERKLWELTNNGEIPCVRIGTLVRYRRAGLEEWALGAEGKPPDEGLRRKPKRLTPAALADEEVNTLQRTGD